jgi:hypothetical protein
MKSTPWLLLLCSAILAPLLVSGPSCNNAVPHQEADHGEDLIEVVATLNQKGFLHALTVSPDGSLLACAHAHFGPTPGRTQPRLCSLPSRG